MVCGGTQFQVVIGVLAVVVPAAVILFILVLQPDQQIIETYQRLDPCVAGT